jgi:hypothetical protein
VIRRGRGPLKGGYLVLGLSEEAVQGPEFWVSSRKPGNSERVPNGIVKPEVGGRGTTLYCLRTRMYPLLAVNDTGLTQTGTQKYDGSACHVI